MAIVQFVTGHRNFVCKLLESSLNILDVIAEVWTDHLATQLRCSAIYAYFLVKLYVSAWLKV